MGSGQFDVTDIRAKLRPAIGLPSIMIMLPFNAEYPRRILHQYSDIPIS